jgi:hypothetical protein
VRDQESEEMLDIILSNKVYDIGAVYAFGDGFIGLITMADDNNRNIAAFYEGREAAMQRDIDRIITGFDDLY